VSFLEELYKRRQTLANLLADPEYSGIREIVEELYPDRAHFIFELLQNAEDAGATEVSFALRHTCLTFEHNGREFSEADVSAITNIGKGTKRDQEDKIGRFGVGFKAVFAYTETPHIWSPRYSFKIAQLVLPVEIDRDISLGQKTKFEFPFNNPNKKERAAFAEIESGLNDLEHTALLFLKHIQNIQWSMTPRLCGNLRRIEHGQNHIEISKQVGARTASAHFLRFCESVPGLQRQQVAIAFDLDFHPNVTSFDPRKTLSQQLRIVPASPGKVAVFFPAEKETAGLRFHLHGPFVPELSRASIKETTANHPLFKQLATVSASALHTIRDLELLNVNFLSVLPNAQDALPARYQPIRKAIVDEMNNERLTPTYAKGHAPASNLFQAKAALKELLSIEDLRSLLPNERQDPQWSATATQRNSDSDRFLIGLDIVNWDVTEFVDLLCERLTNTQRPDEWLSKKSLDWHQQFYALLQTESSLLRPEYIRRNFFDKLKMMSIVRLSNGSYGIGRKSYFPTDSVQHDDILPRVAAGVYTSGKSKIQQTEAKKLLEEIGVREVGEREQVQAILKRYYSAQPSVSETTYVNHLKRFIPLSQTDANISALFGAYYIFRSANGQWVKPDQIYLDFPFVESGLAAYYRAFGNKATRLPLHIFYENLRLPMKGFLRFAEAAGVHVRLSVKRTSCTDNRAFDYLVAKAPGRWSSSGLNEDYAIPDLGRLLNKQDEALSRLVWKTACEMKQTDWLLARFKNSQNQELRTAPSQIAYILRHSAWIPQTTGIFVRPASASPRLLPDGFPYDPGYQWLKAIHFAEHELAQSEENQQQQTLAERLGFPDSEALERAKTFARIPRDIQERILDEFVRSQSDLPEHEPKNPERRAERVSDLAGDAPNKTTQERTRSVSVGLDEVKSRAAEYLREQYTNQDGEMICQACKAVLPFKLADGSYYFEKVEFLKESEKRYYQNYLSLCPNHSAMFIHANDSAEDLPNLFDNLTKSELDVTLAQKRHGIYFTKTHRADLTAIMATLRAVQSSQHTSDACDNEANSDLDYSSKVVIPRHCTSGTRADGAWVRDAKRVCIQHLATARAVYTLVQRKGFILRSELRNRRERQIAIRLALLGYLDCNDYTKDATERRFTICAFPDENVLSL